MAHVPSPPPADHRGAGRRRAQRPSDAALRQARRRTVRRRRLVSAGVLALLVAVALAGRFGGGGRADPPRRLFAIATATLDIRDDTRQAVLADGTVLPRAFTVDIRYPAAGPRKRPTRPGAAPARGGPFPLVVFGHGFGYRPSTYERLLDDWARAGYVVAAPVFPLENADAPGGPYRADLPNQPGDVRLVISRMLDATGPLRGLVDRRRIAVAGHSDGGDTALAAAYGSGRDPRVRAVLVLAGATLPGTDVSAPRTPLLAVQGTADTRNPPASTQAYWDRVRAPKYLLTLDAAGHLPPFTNGPQLPIVRSVTLDFLDRYLRGDQRAGARLRGLAPRAGRYRLRASP